MPEEEVRETEDMAGKTAGRTVRTVRSSKPSGGSTKAGGRRAAPKSGGAKSGGPKPSGGGRSSGPPRTTASKQATAKRGNGAAKTSTGEAAAGFDVEALLGAIEEGVSKIVEEAKKELLESVAEVHAAVAAHGGMNLDGTTALHDMLVQTEGTMMYPETDEKENVVVDEDGTPYMLKLPELALNDDKILAYSKGTAEWPTEAYLNGVKVEGDAGEPAEGEPTEGE